MSMARSLTTMVAKAVDTNALPNLSDLSFAQYCMAFSSLLRVHGLPSRFVGENIYHYAAQLIPLDRWYNPAKTHTVGFGMTSLAGAEKLNAKILTHADSTGSLLDNVTGKMKGKGNGMAWYLMNNCSSARWQAVGEVR